MRRQTRLLATLLVLLLTASARADDAVQVNLATPADTLKTLYRATAAQDPEALRKVFYVPEHDGELQRMLVDGYVNLIVASRKLGETARVKFGQSAPFIPAMAPHDETQREANDSTKIEGDRATLTPVGSSRPIHFIKSHDAWLLDPADYQGVASDDPQRQLATLKSMADAMNEVASGIETNQFATAEEAEATLRQKLYNVMVQAVASPQTRPATQPAAATQHASPSTQPAR